MAVIGVDVGGTKISAGLVKEGKLIKVATEKLCSRNSKSEVVEQIIEIISRLLEFSRDIRQRIKWIGIGVPAIVDLKKGIVYESVNIAPLDKLPLKRIIEKRFKAEVFVNNDANCFALGEKYFGKGKGYSDIVGLIVGTGVGAGIIIDGKLYCGQNCGAGEFGRIPYLNHDIEYYCSGQFFQKEYNIRGEELYQKEFHQKFPKRANEIFGIYGRHLGKALSVIVNSIDPQIIILGGSVSKCYSFFKDSMISSMKESVYKRAFKNIKIEVSRIENIAVLGAASLGFGGGGLAGT